MFYYTSRIVQEKGGRYLLLLLSYNWYCSRRRNWTSAFKISFAIQNAITERHLFSLKPSALKLCFVANVSCDRSSHQVGFHSDDDDGWQAQGVPVPTYQDVHDFQPSQPLPHSIHLTRSRKYAFCQFLQYAAGATNTHMSKRNNHYLVRPHCAWSASKSTTMQCMIPFNCRNALPCWRIPTPGSCVTVIIVDAQAPPLRHSFFLLVEITQGRRVE